MNKWPLYFTLVALIFLPLVTQGQIPVEKDPFHKITFENESVRILDLVIPDSDTTTDHTHSAASVVVFLTKSELAIQTKGQPPVITKVNPGDVIYRPYDQQPTTHNVWSADGSVMRCIVIEIRKSNK